MLAQIVMSEEPMEGPWIVGEKVRVLFAVKYNCELPVSRTNQTILKTAASGSGEADLELTENYFYRISGIGCCYY